MKHNREFTHLYFRLKSRRYEEYGDMISLLRSLPLVKFTHNDILPGLDSSARRNVIRIFNNLGFIVITDNNPRLHVYNVTKKYYEFMDFLGMFGLREFKLGLYKVLMDIDMLNAYLLPSQKPVVITANENIASGAENAPLFHQILIMAKGGAALVRLHILPIPHPLPFIEETEGAASLITLIGAQIQAEHIEQAVIYPEVFNGSFGFTVSGCQGNTAGRFPLHSTYWNPKIKIEENVIKDEICCLTSFMGLIPSGQMLKTIRIEKEK